MRKWTHKWRDALRAYTFNGQEFPSVTTVLDVLDKSAALIPWAVGCALKVVEDNIESDLAVEEVLLKAKNEWREVKDVAAGIGTEVHDVIEQYIKHGTDVMKELRPEVENGFLAFLDWEKENGVHWLESEKHVFSRAFGFAGTADAVCRFDAGPMAGGVYLIDFKTSKGFYDTFAKQIAAYRMAREECCGLKGIEVKGPYGSYTLDYPNLDITGMGILRLDKITGLPEWKDYSKKYEASKAAFIRLVDFYYHDKNRRLKENPFVELAKKAAA